MKYRIAINRYAGKKLPQDDPGWAKFNDSFDNLTLQPIEIADFIYRGYAYTAWHTGRRKQENFICSQHIAIDMDTEDERSAFATLETHDWVRMYASIMHTTQSHTAQAPRARIIFLLDTPIDDVGAFRSAAKFLVAQFDGADTGCIDASRAFHGAKDCDIWLGGNYMPLSQLRHFYRLWERSQRQQSHTPTYNGTPYYSDAPMNDSTAQLIEKVHGAQEGNRNNTLNRQAFLAGKDIAIGRVNEDEVTRALLESAVTIGLGEAEALATIRSGLNAGRAQGGH